MSKIEFIKPDNKKDNMPDKDSSASIQLVAERINSLHSDLTDLRDTMQESMQQMTNAVIRLAQIDERQIYMHQAHDRLAKSLDKLQDEQKILQTRIYNLEKEQPMNKQVVTWVLGGIGFIATLVGGVLAKAAGLL